MIGALVAIIVGWLLAAKVKSAWLGVTGCVVVGILVGAASVAFAVHSAILPVEHSRIPDAVFESSIRFSVMALVFYAIERFVMRRVRRPQSARRAPGNDTRKCPYCAEFIKSEAIVCKHCGRDIAAGVAEQNKRDAVAQAEAQAVAHAARGKEKREQILQLCANLKRKDLDVHSYQAMAAHVGASFTWDKSFFGKYSYTREGTTTTFGKFKLIRPWFLENVVPSIEESF